jgi:murein DD-endopeptidase MepM/ murein hydrolase activator NlpD
VLEPVRGVMGDAAAHEGDDYINADASLADVGVVAAAVGTVVYARRGCPPSTVFAPNQSLREGGAGWGNHVILQHHDVYTRYAHLANMAVVAGDARDGKADRHDGR